MDAMSRKVFRLTMKDIKELMEYLEKNNGPNRFSKED
jgi:hypothetical protein